MVFNLGPVGRSNLINYIPNVLNPDPLLPTFIRTSNKDTSILKDISNTSTIYLK